MTTSVLVTGTDDTSDARDELRRLLDAHNPDIVVTGSRVGIEYQARAWARQHDKAQINIPCGPRTGKLSEYKEWDDALFSALFDEQTDCESLLVVATAGARWPLVARCRVNGISIVEINSKQIGLFG